MSSLQAETHVGMELSPLKLLPWGRCKSWNELLEGKPSWEDKQGARARPELHGALWVRQTLLRQ